MEGPFWQVMLKSPSIAFVQSDRRLQASIFTIHTSDRSHIACVHTCKLLTFPKCTIQIMFRWEPYLLV